MTISPRNRSLCIKTDLIYPKADNADFINNRGAAAEDAYEKAFRSGLTPNQAKEVAMKVLMEGIE